MRNQAMISVLGVLALGAAGLRAGTATPPEAASPPVWEDSFWRRQVPTSLSDLFEARRHGEALSRVIAAVENAPDGEAAFETWTTFTRLLPGLDPGLAQRTLRAERARTPTPRPAVLLVEARLRLHPAWRELYAPAPARRALAQLGQEQDQGAPGAIAALARFEAACLDAQADPARALATLRRLAQAKGPAGPLAGLTTLMLGRALQQTDATDEALALYQRGARRFRSVRLVPEGPLAAYFHHGAAEVLAAVGRTEAATEEYAQLLARYPDYPARRLVEESRAQIEKGR